MRSTQEEQDDPPKNKKIRISCTLCGSTNLCFEENETYCRKCGLVIQGVPSVDHYPHGYIIGNKRLMYINKRVKVKKEGKKHIG